MPKPRIPITRCSLALAALDLSPALAPAAALAARKLAAEGRVWRAQDVIEAAWAQTPHPDLAAAYAAIKPDETPEERAERLIGLAHLKRDHFESRMLEAEQDVNLSNWSEARRVLAPLAARLCQRAGLRADGRDRTGRSGTMPPPPMAGSSAPCARRAMPNGAASACGWSSAKLAGGLRIIAAPSTR